MLRGETIMQAFVVKYAFGGEFQVWLSTVGTQRLNGIWMPIQQGSLCWRPWPTFPTKEETQKQVFTYLSQCSAFFTSASSFIILMLQAWLWTTSSRITSKRTLGCVLTPEKLGCWSPMANPKMMFTLQLRTCVAKTSSSMQSVYNDSFQ